MAVAFFRGAKVKSVSGNLRIRHAKKGKSAAVRHVKNGFLIANLL